MSDRVQRLITEAEAAALASVSVDTLRRLRREGHLRPGREYRLIAGRRRLLRYAFPQVLQRMWEIGIPQSAEERVRPRPVRPRTPPRRTVNLDWNPASE